MTNDIGRHQNSQYMRNISRFHVLNQANTQHSSQSQQKSFNMKGRGAGMYNPINYGGLGNSVDSVEENSHSRIFVNSGQNVLSKSYDHISKGNQGRKNEFQNLVTLPTDYKIEPGTKSFVYPRLAGINSNLNDKVNNTKIPIPSIHPKFSFMSGGSLSQHSPGYFKDSKQRKIDILPQIPNPHDAPTISSYDKANFIQISDQAFIALQLYSNWLDYNTVSICYKKYY